MDKEAMLFFIALPAEIQYRGPVQLSELLRITADIA